MPSHLLAWFDVPVKDLARARTFYETVLGWKMEEDTPGVAVFEHHQGMTGGCLTVDPNSGPSTHGALLYYNVTGRHVEAEALVAQCGGEVLAPKHPIGPFGYRSIILDSEGNRLALHSDPEVA